jgi:hypothetical protein
MLTGCIPPQGIALGLLIPVVILLVLACVITSYFPEVGRLTLALTHLASLLSLYTFPSLTLFLRAKVRSNYALSLISASLSGLILFVSAVVLRKYGETIPAAWQCGLFGFLLFFMINLGYYLTDSEMTFISVPSPKKTATEEDKREQFVLRMLVLDQLHYLNFLFAPLVALLVAWWKPQADRLAMNIVVTLGLFGLSIALAAVVKGSLLSFGLENNEKSADPVALYTRLTDLRVIMFYSVIHDFLTASFLTFAMAQVYSSNVVRSLKIAGAFGGLMAIMFGLLPFFFGQKSVVDLLAQSESTEPTDREALRQKLVKVRPLIPKSLPLTGLFGLLTAGGIFSYLIDLLGK